MDLSPYTVYLKIAAFAAVAGILFTAGRKVEAWRADARYSALQSSDAAARADGEAAVRKDLQAQLDTLKSTSANNAAVLGKLQNENASIAADRDANMDLARRLLASQAGPAAPSGLLPKADSGSAATVASGTGSDESLASAVADVADEAERNANRLDALSAQIGPQL